MTIFNPGSQNVEVPDRSVSVGGGQSTVFARSGANNVAQNEDPIGRYRVFLYLRSGSAPSAPTDVTWTPNAGIGTLSGTNASGWTLTPPSGSDQLYFIVELFNPTTTATISSWTAPVALGGGTGVGGGSDQWHVYAVSTAYSAGDYIYYAGNHRFYYVQAAITATQNASGSTPDDLPLYFVPLDYLTRQQGNLAYLNRPTIAEGIATSLTGAVTIASRADATGTIRVNSFIDSSTAQIGFWDAEWNFGNFPTTLETFNARTSSTTWASLFTGDYRNIAINLGESPTEGFLQSFYAGHIGNNVIEMLFRTASDNWSIWKLNGGYYGTEGHVIYFGRHAPTLVASQGSGPGTANLELFISLTSEGVYSAVSTSETLSSRVVGADGMARQVDSTMIEDDAVEYGKIDVTGTAGQVLTINSDGDNWEFATDHSGTSYEGTYTGTGTSPLAGRIRFLNSSNSNIGFNQEGNGLDTIETLLINGLNATHQAALAALEAGSRVYLTTGTGADDHFSATVATVSTTSNVTTLTFSDTDKIAPSAGRVSATANAITLRFSVDDAGIVFNRDIVAGAIDETKLNIGNHPASGEVLLWTPDGWVWSRQSEGVLEAELTPDDREGLISTSSRYSIADGSFALYSQVTVTGVTFLSNDSNLNTATHFQMDTLDADSNDLRSATSRFKSGSIIYGRKNGSSDYFIIRLGDLVSSIDANIRAVTVLKSSGTRGGDDTRWDLSVRSAERIPIAGPDLVINETTGNTTSTPLFTDSNGVLREGNYVDFSASDAGIVNSPGTGIHPNPNTIVNAIQTQPLRYTASAGGIITGTRGWQLIHNGDVVPLADRPTTWDEFDHSSDDVGMWISVEDLTTAERNRLTAFGTANDRNTLEVLAVNAEDHSAYMIANFGPDAVDNTDDTLDDGDGGHFVNLGGGSFTIVAQQGSPSANLKFYFPTTTALTGANTIDLSETTPNPDRFVNATNTWTELNVNPLDTLSDVLDTQLSPFRLVDYNISSATVKYKQWDTKIEGHIYHFTVFYNFTSNVITTAQVYHGHWTTTPTGTDATSFLFGTRTYTTSGWNNYLVR